jgi:hypothetical protein
LAKPPGWRRSRVRALTPGDCRIHRTCGCCKEQSALAWASRLDSSGAQALWRGRVAVGAGGEVDDLDKAFAPTACGASAHRRRYHWRRWLGLCDEPDWRGLAPDAGWCRPRGDHSHRPQQSVLREVLRGRDSRQHRRRRAADYGLHRSHPSGTDERGGLASNRQSST